MRSLRSSLTWRSLRFGAFWPIVILSLQGCVPIDYFEARMLTMQDEYKAAMSDAAAAQSQRIGRIEEFLTYCPDEVQKLLGRVEKECDNNETCMLSEADIRIEVRKVAWQGARFQSLMQDRKHVSFFMAEEGRELQDAEKKALRDLVMPAWLEDGTRKTRFLVVSHSLNTAPEQLRMASKRGKFVIKELMTIAESMGKAQATGTPVPSKAQEPASAVAHAVVSTSAASAPAAALKKPDASSLQTAAEAKRPYYILHWSLPYPRGGELPKFEDRPKVSGEKLTSSVFVYRVDC